MADHQDDPVEDDFEWQVDDDGTEFFVEDGVRYELAEDGFAYPVEEDDASDPGDAAAADDDAAPVEAREPEPFTRAAADDETTEIATVEVAEASWPGSGSDGAAVPVLLELRDLESGYGALPVLHGVSTQLRQGETAVLLGLNGAGKTTTALNVCGALPSWGGSITFDGQDITGWNVKKCVANGIVMVPEGRRVFPDLSVGKNLQIGAWSQRRQSGWQDEQREAVFTYFPRLREREHQLAGTLSGGEQQMLAIGRGLMANPRLLIIDEASMGLAPVIVNDVFDIVRQINRDGVTVLLIEQNIGALDVADLGLVMEQGRMVKELRGDRLRDRNEVSSVLMG